MLMGFYITEAMEKGKALTDLERGRIQGLHEAGLQGALSLMLSIGHGTQ